MPSPVPTLRALALSLGVSRTTVSDALRGSGRVAASTAEHIRRAAEAVHYRPNPLTGSVMAELRRGRAHTFRGTLALVDLHEPDRKPHGPFHDEIIHGVRTRATDLGFSIEQFVCGPKTLPQPRLDGIMQARGILGVVVLPSWYAPDVTGLQWSRYAGVYTDYSIERPSLHSVCADHYHLVITALTLLRERGYQRPGLVLQQGRDLRVEHRQNAAFRAYSATHFPAPKVPPLITSDDANVRSEFLPWFRRHRPDVVLSHFEETIDWMSTCGARVPQTHGFVALNNIGCQRPCAALDLQGRLIGARAAELLVSQIQRNEFGLPEWPSRTLIPARWVEGPTVRPPLGA